MIERVIKKIVATLLLLLDAMFMFGFILAFLGTLAGILFGRTPFRMLASFILAVVYLFLIVATIIVGDWLWKIIEE